MLESPGVLLGQAETHLDEELEAERRGLQEICPFNLKHIWLEYPAVFPAPHGSVSLLSSDSSLAQVFVLFLS